MKPLLEVMMMTTMMVLVLVLVLVLLWMVMGHHCKRHFLREDENPS